MVKINRIYTKTGDDGSTGLADGSRISKADPRIDSYGSVDELNAVLGLSIQALNQAGAPAVAVLLQRVQNDLFDLGADLATPQSDQEDGALRIVASQVEFLESAIDDANEGLAPLTSFVLPGGSEASGWLHLARTVCRRAERVSVALNAAQTVNPEALRYLNRLSDLLFVLARVANAGGEDDVLWVPAQGRDAKKKST